MFPCSPCNFLERARTPLLASPANRARVAGRLVEVLNDEIYGPLRAAHQVPEDFLENGQKSQGLNLEMPRSESHHGKGGQAQFESGCRRYVIKSLSKDDNETLQRIAGPLVERMLDGSTMLCPIYMHFKDIATGQYFMVMRNLTEGGPWSAKYDLKGCDDDKTLEVNGKLITPVRKRFYRPHMWCACMWSSERWAYYRGKVQARTLKLGLAETALQEVVKQISADADWLISQSIMDYSLLIAIRRLPPDVAKSCGAGPLPVAAPTSAPPGLHRWAMLDKATGELVVIHMGIIDFLQPWTMSKVAAMYIKSFEFNKATVPPPHYGQRFAKHFQDRLKEDANLVQQPETVAAAAESRCSADEELDAKGQLLET